MSELQNEAVEPEFDVSEENSNEEAQDLAPSDLAPDSGAEHEQEPQAVTAEDEEAKKQDAIQKAINKKHFEAKEAERKAEEYRKKLEAYEQAELERKAQQIGNIPPMPDDPFEDDYQEKLKAHIEAKAAKERFDVQQAIIQQQKQQAQRQIEAQKAIEFNQQVQTYAKRATELGIKQEELQVAANTVGKLGLSDDLVKFIIADSDGPLIVKHLAENQIDGLELAQLSPYLVGQKLNEIKQRASNLKPKSTAAPKPSQRLDGSGKLPEDRYKNISGAKFE